MAGDFPKALEGLVALNIFIVLGTVLLLLLVVIAVYKKDKALLFCITAGIAAIVPLSVSLLQERNFLFVGIALSPVIARFLSFLWHVEKPEWQGVAKVTFSLVFLFRVVICALILVYVALFIDRTSRSILASAESVPESFQDKKLITFGAPIIHSAFVYPIAEVENLTIPEALWNISTEHTTIQLSRETETRFVVTAPQGILHKTDMKVRDLKRDKFKDGDVVLLSGMQIQIQKVDDTGNPVELYLILSPEELDDYRFARWGRKGFSVLQLGVGQSIELESSPVLVENLHGPRLDFLLQRR